MKRFEFSKLILLIVVATYFITLVFGMGIIRSIAADNPEYAGELLEGMFTFAAAPVSVAIGFYSYKAKAENVEKIKTNTNTMDNG